MKFKTLTYSFKLPRMMMTKKSRESRDKAMDLSSRMMNKWKMNKIMMINKIRQAEIKSTATRRFR
jgi:hypothetical protein